MTASHSEPEQPVVTLPEPVQLRICFISRALPVHRLGGLEYHLRDLATALAARGHLIHILTTKNGSTASLGENIHVHEIAGTQPGDYSLGFFRRAGAAAQTVAEKYGADVVCSIDMAGLFLAPADFKAPLFAIIHGTLTSEVPLDWRYWSHIGWRQRLAALWRYKSRIALLRAFRRMVERTDHLIVDSEFTQRELMFGVGGADATYQAGAKAAEMYRKIQVVSLGIDGNRYPTAQKQQGADTEKLRICILGRLQEMKGIGVALHAAAALKARGVLFELTIGGTGDFEGRARELVARLGLNEVVGFSGRVEPEDLALWFASHDLFLFPDLTQPAFGLVAVEAMHYGLPVVAARVGAVPEVVTESCGWLYEPWDVNELAGLLMRLGDNRAEVAAKAGCAKIRAAEFTATGMAERFEKAVLKVLAEK